MTHKLLKRLSDSQNTKAFLIIFAVLLAVYVTPPFIHRSQNPIYQRAALSSELASGVTHGQSTIDPNDGFTSQALGHRAAEDWLHGNIPYWNHDEGVGAPLAGEMQSAALFPLVLLLHFGNGLVYFHFVLQLMAGIATYFFFRKLKLRFAVAVLGGVLFALSGAFAWLTNAPFNPIAFLPLLLLGVEQAIHCAETKRTGGWVLIALALSLSLYAGFPEGAFINAIFAYGWAAIRLLQIKAKNRKPYIYKVIIGTAVGLLLAAPILVAFADYLPHAITGGHGSGSYANLGLSLDTLPALFMPYIFGPIFDFIRNGTPTDLYLFWSNVGGYITMPLVVVALLGCFAKRPRSQKIYLALFALAVALRIYNFKPVNTIINTIPGMNQVAFYRYSVPALAMALIILAMFGVEAMVSNKIEKKRIVILSAVACLWVLIMAFLSRHLLHQLTAFPQHKHWAVVSIVWGLSVVVVAVLAFVQPRIRLAGLITLLSIDALVMFTIPFLALPKTTGVDQPPVTYLQKNLGLSRFYTLHPIAPNYSSYFDIASVNINDLPIPKAWDKYITKNLDSNTPSILFTGYTRTNPNGPTPLNEFGKNINNYEAVGVKYLVTDAGQVNNSYSMQYGLAKVYSDPNIEIFALPKPQPYFATSHTCSISAHGRDSLTVSCPQKSTLTRQELSFPGWATSVNGQSKPISTNQEIFQSVDLPAGESSVRFSYNPPFIAAGYIALAAGLTLLAAQFVMFARKSHHKTSNHD